MPQPWQQPSLSDTSTGCWQNHRHVSKPPCSHLRGIRLLLLHPVVIVAHLQLAGRGFIQKHLGRRMQLQRAGRVIDVTGPSTIAADGFRLVLAARQQNKRARFEDRANAHRDRVDRHIRRPIEEPRVVVDRRLRQAS